MTSTMRRKNTGSFDHTTSTWRLKGKGIQASTRKLSLMFGVDLPKNEIISRPYWMKYLESLTPAKPVFAPPQWMMEAVNQPQAIICPNGMVLDGNVVSQIKTLEIPQADSLQREVEVYIERAKQKGHKGWYDTRSALTFS